MMNVGVDVHKRTCQACLEDERGDVVEELRFRNNLEGAAKLAMVLKKHREPRYPWSRPAIFGELCDRLNEEGNKRIRWIPVEAAQHA
jgi:hypothetical protein